MRRTPATLIQASPARRRALRAALAEWQGAALALDLLSSQDTERDGGADEMDEAALADLLAEGQALLVRARQSEEAAAAPSMPAAGRRRGSAVGALVAALALAGVGLILLEGQPLLAGVSLSVAALSLVLALQLSRRPRRRLPRQYASQEDWQAEAEDWFAAWGDGALSATIDGAAIASGLGRLARMEGAQAQRQGQARRAEALRRQCAELSASLGTPLGLESATLDAASERLAQLERLWRRADSDAEALTEPLSAAEREDLRRELIAIEGEAAACIEASSRDALAMEAAARRAAIEQLIAEHSALSAQLGPLLQAERLPTEIEARLETLRGEQARASRELAEIDLARELVEASRVQLRARIAPRVQRLAAALLAELADDPAEGQVSVDRDFALRLREADSSFYREAAYYSGGRIDQLYLALRLALVDLLYGPDALGGRLPLLLDDVMAQYDDRRMQASLALLQRQARETGRQILLTSCHEAVASAAARLGIAIVDLAEP